MKNLPTILIVILFMSNTTQASELTSEYLVGNWCFKSINFGDEVEKENRNWVFESDGKFLLQNSTTSEKLKHSANWDLKDNQLQIKPVYMGGYKEVEIISQDEFIFKWMSDLQIVRGECQ